MVSWRGGGCGCGDNNVDILFCTQDAIPQYRNTGKQIYIKKNNNNNIYIFFKQIGEWVNQRV